MRPSGKGGGAPSAEDRGTVASLLRSLSLDDRRAEDGACEPTQATRHHVGRSLDLLDGETDTTLIHQTEMANT